MTARKAQVVGVDIGGTFIDYVVVAADGTLAIHKELSDPADLAGAFSSGLARVAPGGAHRVVHGTTVATNALLERRGARTALLATKGFADVLAIGRQARPALYALAPSRPDPLVPGELRLEVGERVAADGSVLAGIDEDALGATMRALADAKVESVAVSLLFSFLHPAHEERVAQALAQALPKGVFVALSSRVLPEYREYERTSTTVATAYVGPVLDRYLGKVASAIGAPLQVMQSNGGVVDAGHAAEHGAALVLSGPAAGVVGAAATAAQAGFDQVVTFDMGGTSTDVSVCPGTVLRTSEAEVAGVPIRLPMIDVHTVGAGGGSLARVDASGGLRVGPESAGARPGPACYGRGERPTVTDADVVLGRLGPAPALAGGSLALNTDRARAAVAELGGQLGLSTEEAALGILAVVHAAMVRAIRRVSVERGHDPRGFTLVAFGGAGPVHAAELAAELGLPRVLVPAFPGVASAQGMVSAQEVRDLSLTVRNLLYRGAPSVPTPGGLASWANDVDPAWWAPLEAQASGWRAQRWQRSADLRYQGQSFEIEVPVGEVPMVADALVERFEAAHRQLYGWVDPERAVEVVTVRLRGVTDHDRRFEPPPVSGARGGGQSQVRFRPGWCRAEVVDRWNLPVGEPLAGPALLSQADTVTVVPPGWGAARLPTGDLLLEAAP